MIAIDGTFKVSFGLFVVLALVLAAAGRKP